MTDQTAAAAALSGPRRRAAMPAFAPPQPTDPLPPDTDLQTDRIETLTEAAAVRVGPLTDRLGPPDLPPRPLQIPTDPDTHTAASPPGKPTQAETAKLVAGLLGLVALGAAFIVQFRRRTLRKPTKAQLREMADPLARIGLRHVDPGVLNPDLIDIIGAGTALGDYLTDGPLIITGLPTDPGVPADLQNLPED